MDQERLAGRLARYGLPAVIVIFYVTATLGFGYTPEGTFAALVPAGDSSLPTGSVSPLWLLLLATGGAFGLDFLLTAKVLSLVFSSLAVLMSFLLAVEVLGNRVLGLCVALMVAVQSWLLQLSVTGHPLAFALLLCLAGLFFVARNDYMTGALILALAVLVFWQAVGLLVILLVDAVLNSRDRSRGVRLATAAAAIAGGVLALWAAIAAFRGRDLLPVLPGTAGLDHLSTGGVLGVALTGGLAAAGFIVLIGNRSGGRELMVALSPFVGTILWCAAGPGARTVGLWHLSVPLLLILALFGLRVVLDLWQRGHLVYGMALAFAGIVVMQNQLDFTLVTRPRMAAVIADSEELLSIAYWLRSHSGPEEQIEGEQALALAYFAGRPVRSFSGSPDPSSRYVVSSAPGLDGFRSVYRSPVRFSVYRRTGE